MIYQKYVEYKSMLALSNAKPHERDLSIYSNVLERDDSGLSIYPKVPERIPSILSIYSDVCGIIRHSSECIERQLLSFIDSRTCLLSYLSLHLDNVFLVSNNGVGSF